MKPRSEACERNREPILAVLQRQLIEPCSVFEIGAGTGQHAVFFAERMPHVDWIPSDREENLPGIRQWVMEAQSNGHLANLHQPVRLDVTDKQWPLRTSDHVFTANTTHIMSWSQVERMFEGVSELLAADGRFFVYGPFNRDGEFTSESNRAFDASLRARDPAMGIRDDRALIALGQTWGLRLDEDHALPANNRLLIWSKRR